MFKTITSCNVSLCIAEKMNDVSLYYISYSTSVLCTVTVCVQIRLYVVSTMKSICYAMVRILL